MAQPEDERPPYEPAPLAVSGKRGLYWQSDYALLVAAVTLVTAIAFAFFYFDLDITKLRTYGYLGVFAISLIGAASIFLPTPAIAAVFGGSVLLDPILGIPTPILVGLVAGLGETLGEFTGYAAGYGGGAAIQGRAFYGVVRSWMDRHGTITMFVFSAIPNPIFDVAGIIAGATRMPWLRFFLSVWAGKTVKDILIAAMGVASLGLIERLFD
jgi:membrane protein YqaA with SNARE-associated domain